MQKLLSLGSQTFSNITNIDNGIYVDKTGNKALTQIK